jgi:hypothetical protein
MADTTTAATENRDEPTVDSGNEGSRPTSERPARETTERTADNMLWAAQTMADVARRAMDQGQEAMRLCLSAMTEPQVSFVETTYAQGRRAAASTTDVAGAYQQAMDRAAADIEGLIISYTRLVRGAQQWQQACLELAQRGFEKFGRKPQEALRCASPSEAARLQRDLYLDMVETMISSNMTMFQLLSQIAQDALCPLQDRSRPAV